MPLLASLSAFGYYSGCVDCRLSLVACDILSVLVLSTSVERIFSISREASREKETGWLIMQETLLLERKILKISIPLTCWCYIA